MEPNAVWATWEAKKGGRRLSPLLCFQGGILGFCKSCNPNEGILLKIIKPVDHSVYWLFTFIIV